MKTIKTVIEGFIIGLGKIMPGVSGSVMAICFGVYERLIECLSSIKSMKKDFKFLSVISFGILIAIIIGSNIIKILLDNYFLYTIFFFIGMMLPGVYPLFKEIKNEDVTFKRVFTSMMVFFFLIIINTLNLTTGGDVTGGGGLREFLSLIFCGIIDAASTIIPGISGSAILMLIGYYEKIISSLANVFSLESIIVLIPFGIGLILGIILISKLISYLFKRHRPMTFMLIIAFICFSIVALTMKGLTFIEVPLDLAFSLFFTILGFIASLILERIFKT